MRYFDSINEVLDLAIDRESEAHAFYRRIADMVKDPELVKILKDFATEEVVHRIKLEALKAGDIEIVEKEADNLKVAFFYFCS